LANWLKGWRYQSDSSSSGLVRPTKEQIIESAVVAGAFAMPATAPGRLVLGALARMAGKRFFQGGYLVVGGGQGIPWKGLPPLYTATEVSKNLGIAYYNFLNKRDKAIVESAESSGRRSQSYQPIGYPGDTINPLVYNARFNRSLRKSPTNIHGKKGYHIPTHLRCPPGYKLTYMGFGRYACLPN